MWRVCSVAVFSSSGFRSTDHFFRLRLRFLPLFRSVHGLACLAPAPAPLHLPILGFLLFCLYRPLCLLRLVSTLPLSFDFPHRNRCNRSHRRRYFLRTSFSCKPPYDLKITFQGNAYPQYRLPIRFSEILFSQETVPCSAVISHNSSSPLSCCRYSIISLARHDPLSSQLHHQNLFLFPAFQLCIPGSPDPLPVFL